MAKQLLKDISSKMRNLDICMMTTQANNGLLSRPMSNNGEVEYDGNSYFFSYEKSGVVKEIEETSDVNLAFNGDKDLYIAVTGKAKLKKNKTKMQEHWIDELKKWFENGLDTPGIVMIHVKAKRIRYWQGEENGDVKF